MTLIFIDHRYHRSEPQYPSETVWYPYDTVPISPCTAPCGHVWSIAEMLGTFGNCLVTWIVWWEYQGSNGDSFRTLEIFIMGIDGNRMGANHQDLQSGPRLFLH